MHPNFAPSYDVHVSDAHFDNIVGALKNRVGRLNIIHIYDIYSVLFTVCWHDVIYNIKWRHKEEFFRKPRIILQA